MRRPLKALSFSLSLAHATLFACSAPAPARAADPAPASQPVGDFRNKLHSMLERIDRSITIVRTQITESQNAPFLPDLYLQLGELLSQRANALYYIQMEKDNKTTGSVSVSAGGVKFSSVIRAQKDAIAIFKLILKDFPKSDKRPKVYHYLTVSYRSIDEIPAMIENAAALLKEFPSSVEAMRSQLVLAQHFYDKREWETARAPLLPVLDCEFVYEKNAARYRMGLIHLGEEKHAESLKLFESVVTDDELKEEEDPVEVSITSQVVKTNLKREALIDSVRAYTYVHKDETHDPIGYYSGIAPSEQHFQEVIEKLAVRLISLKRYKVALQLLRTLTERVSDPLKALNIYQEVLLKMTVEERLKFPPEELGSVLERLVVWTTTYNVPMNLILDSKNFFEKQTRELATTSHESAKAATEPEARKVLLRRARDLYQIYLKFFKDSSFAPRMAANLGDVHFLEKSYPKCGEVLLRLSEGEYGKAPQDIRVRAIQDSLHCLQQKDDYPFYEQIRVRGLQIRAATAYMAIDKRKAADPAIHLLQLKAEYEQGFFETVLPRLYSFISRFRRAKQATDAADLVLDYHNTRNDLPELQRAADRILKLGIGDAAYQARLNNIRKRVDLTKLLDKVESISISGNATEAKSYLTAAVGMDDPSLRSIALQKALATSKRDRDTATFFKTAGIFAQQEKDPEKKANLLISMASEKMRITRYRDALGILEQVHGGSGYPAALRARAYETALSIAVSLRDPGLIESLAARPGAGNLPQPARERAAKVLADYLDSPHSLSSSGEQTLLRLNGQQPLPGSLYKSRVPAARTYLHKACQASAGQPPCAWLQLEQAEKARAAVLAAIRSAPRSLDEVQKLAPRVAETTARFQGLEGKGDPQIDMITALRSHEILEALAGFLRAAAQAQAEFGEILAQKAEESSKAAKAHLERCRLVASRSAAVTPVNRHCDTGTTLQLAQLVHWTVKPAAVAGRGDPSSAAHETLQKAIFAADNDPDPLLQAATVYLEAGLAHHAAAAALIGVGLYPALEPDFSAVAGCATLKLGLFGEANFHLKRASDHRQLKTACAAQLTQLTSAN